jgi:hypothetical protein
MKLKDYAKLIAVFAEKHPDILVIYAADDEGNRFEPINYVPSAGHYDENSGEFTSPGPRGQKTNAICVN